MTGWNLPPGCNVSDLPGNGPEDPIAEKIAELLWEELDGKISDLAIEKLHRDIMEQVEEARA